MASTYTAIEEQSEVHSRRRHRGGGRRPRRRGLGRRGRRRREHILTDPPMNQSADLQIEQGSLCLKMRFEMLCWKLSKPHGRR